MIRKNLLVLLIIPLLFSCKKEPIPHYEIEVLNCENPYLLHFKSLSENTTSEEWYIDGQYYVGDNVKVNLHSGESHTLQLIASNEKRKASVEAVFLVEDYYSLPIPEFSWNYPDCADHTTISLYNRTEGITESYFWDFDDGATSTAISPTHTFSTNGTYNVKLCAIRCNDSIWLTKTIYINETNLQPEADFNATATKNNVDDLTFLRGTTVSLKSNANNNSSVIWRLWDGSTSFTNSFSKTFPNEGEYEIELVAICGEKRDSIRKTITIIEPETMTINSIVLDDFDDENEDGESWDDEEGKPDIYLKIIRFPYTIKTTSTDNDVSSFSNPSWNIDEELTNLDDDYTIEVWDRDSGSDDFMNSFSFEPDDFYSGGNYPSSITLTDGLDWKIVLDVEWE